MAANPETSAAVIAAYREAKITGQPATACYLAAIDAWRAKHPDHIRREAARQAVEIVQNRFGAYLEAAKE